MHGVGSDLHSVPHFKTAPLASDDNPTTLTPFEVRTDKDTGFAASSALAGGRLATDLRDTPASYSVVTREFIDALNLDNLQDVAQWTPSTTAQPDNGQQNFFQIDTVYSTRGVSNGRPQRNFFPQFSLGDTYNLERVDFGRGPNSILFGNGTLGGVSSVMTKRASPNRPSQTVKFGVGSWSYYRGMIDVNQPINKQ